MLTKNVIAALIIFISGVNSFSPWGRGKGECGVVSRRTSLIINGEAFQRGTWPWLVAVLYVKPNRDANKKAEAEYICGGALVSSLKILTAAHCIIEKDQGTRKLERNIILKIGAYDLSDPHELEISNVSPSKIFVHPDYNQYETKYDADIAVMTLRKSVTFGAFIKPICLPTGQRAASEGYVAGWGESQNNALEIIPRQIKTPITTNEKCFLANPWLALLSSERTFCAGAANMQGPCRGDSGSGLYVQHGGIFQLKGIVSASLVADETCDVSTFAVYTDVEKYVHWIENPSEEKISSDQRFKNARTPLINCSVTHWNSWGHLGKIRYCFPGDTVKISKPGETIGTSGEHAIDAIDFNNNPKVEYLPVKLYQNFPNLKGLAAWQCSVRKISRENFLRLTKLQELDLHHNRIEKISSSTFKDLVSLKWLHLNHNQIKSVNPEDIVLLPALVEAFLQGNNCLEKRYVTSTSLSEMLRDITAHCSLNEYDYD